MSCQAHQNSGNPCRNSTSGPLPPSTTWKRLPLAPTKRCVHGPSTSTPESSMAPSLGGDSYPYGFRTPAAQPQLSNAEPTRREGRPGGEPPGRPRGDGSEDPDRHRRAVLAQHRDPYADRGQLDALVRQFVVEVL